MVYYSDELFAFSTGGFVVELCSQNTTNILDGFVFQVGTLCQVLVVPTLFVIFQSLQEKFSPMKFEGDEENPDVTTELQQYAKRPVDYELQK